MKSIELDNFGLVRSFSNELVYSLISFNFKCVPIDKHTESLKYTFEFANRDFGEAEELYNYLTNLKLAKDKIGTLRSSLARFNT
jgi:hypothetical protein